MKKFFIVQVMRYTNYGEHMLIDVYVCFQWKYLKMEKKQCIHFRSLLCTLLESDH